MHKPTKGPARAVPPGQLIQRELDARGWTQNDLAEVMGRPAQAISEILTGKKQITAETAIELGEAFGVDASFWSTLQSNYKVGRTQSSPTSRSTTRNHRYGSVRNT